MYHVLESCKLHDPMAAAFVRSTRSPHALTVNQQHNQNCRWPTRQQKTALLALVPHPRRTNKWQVFVKPVPVSLKAPISIPSTKTRAKVNHLSHHAHLLQVTIVFSDDGWANVTPRPTLAAADGGMMSNAANVATGAAKLIYGHAVGDEAAKKAGKEAFFEKQ